ncbi:putative ribonuclease H-like domain-containing protein [Tanacetum coccineum]
MPELHKQNGLVTACNVLTDQEPANQHAGLQEANQNAGTEDIIDAGDSKKEDDSAQDYFVLPIWSSYSLTIKRSRAEDAVADFTNLETVVNVSPIPTSRINSFHPSTLILGDPQSAVQTRNLPYEKRAIGTKWVYRNKKDEERVLLDNKARIEAIRIFLAFASYMGFIVYQMDMKSAFLYGKLDEEVYVSQPPGFIDPKYPQKVYKVVKALYGLHQAPRAWPTVDPQSDPFPRPSPSTTIPDSIPETSDGNHGDFLQSSQGNSTLQAQIKNSEASSKLLIHPKTTEHGCKCLIETKIGRIEDP